jgi:hypothetical protein
LFSTSFLSKGDNGGTLCRIWVIYYNQYTIVSQKTIVIDGNSTTVQANWSSSWNTSSFGSLGNDGTLIIVDNPNTTQRAAVITLTQEGSGKQVTITVRQKKKNSVDIED